MEKQATKQINSWNLSTGIREYLNAKIFLYNKKF